MLLQSYLLENARPKLCSSRHQSSEYVQRFSAFTIHNRSKDALLKRCYTTRSSLVDSSAVLEKKFGRTILAVSCYKFIKTSKMSTEEEQSLRGLPKGSHRYET